MYVVLEVLKNFRTNDDTSMVINGGFTRYLKAHMSPSVLINCVTENKLKDLAESFCQELSGQVAQNSWEKERATEVNKELRRFFETLQSHTNKAGKTCPSTEEALDRLNAIW